MATYLRVPDNHTQRVCIAEPRTRGPETRDAARSAEADASYTPVMLTYILSSRGGLVLPFLRPQTTPPFYHPPPVPSHPIPRRAAPRWDVRLALRLAAAWAVHRLTGCRYLPHPGQYGPYVPTYLTCMHRTHAPCRAFCFFHCFSAPDPIGIRTRPRRSRRACRHACSRRAARVLAPSGWAWA